MRRFTASGIESESQRLGLGIRSDELEAYARLVNTLLETVEPIERAQTQAICGASTNDVQRIANALTPEERAGRDPLNAIVRFVSVKSTDARAESGRLAGMRVVIKDNVAIAGIPMTCGSRVLQGFVPTVDATVVTRMLDAGAEIVGVANMEDMAFSGGSETSYYGPIDNPCDRSRVAGGSSGGSAASLAYPWVDIAIGGDQGGSVRIPAAWCGVIGHKPTHSLVPYTGALGIDPTIDHLGPFARSVSDVAKTLHVIAGRDPGDPRQVALDASPVADALEHLIADQADLGLTGLKIGLLSEGWSTQDFVDPTVASAAREAVERFAGLGATLEDVSVPEHATSGPPSFSMFAEGLVNALHSGGLALGAFGRYWPELAVALGRGLETTRADVSPQVKATLIVGTLLRERYYHATYGYAMQRRDQIRAAFDAAFERVDVLAMPTLPTLPYEKDPSLPLDESVMRGWSMLANTTTFNMTGHPAISLPVSKVDGLPVGLMLVGRAFSDAELLRIAAAYERAHGWALGADGSLGASM